MLLSAGVASEIGDWFTAVAILAVAHDIGGTFAVGFVLALRSVPRLLFQAPAGALVDRWPTGATLIWSHLAMGAIATSFLLIDAVPQLWLLALLILALESVNTVALPVYRVQVIGTVPSEHMGGINGLLSTAMTASQFVGPVLGALVLAWLGLTPVFVINGLTFIAVAAAVAWSLRSRRDADVRAFGEDDRVTELTETAPEESGGYGWLLRQTDLALFAAAALGVTVAVRGGIALFVDRSDALGMGDGGPGYFFAAVGLGAIAGGIGAGTGAHLDRSALAWAAVAMASCALLLAAFGAVDSVVLALVALALAGLTTNAYEVLGLTYFQHRLPPDRYGRFMSIFILALGIGGIVGALAAPLLESELSVRASLLVLSLPGVALSLVLLSRTLGGRGSRRS